MSFTAIRYELDGPEGARTATITLNRPEQLNAFDGEMRRDLMTALLQAQEEARALVLTGAGRGFCAGQDLGDMGQPEKVELERLLNEEYHPAIMALANCSIPTICAVNGVAAGAGANLALSADIVIAGRSARFLQAFARIGLMPDAGGTYWLP
ncbi:MAG: enoyl-CoA hydratase-related protein, partial [Pseudomonadota bacterium]